MELYSHTHAAISWLARALSRPQTARKARHNACKKQLEKTDAFTVVVCGSDI